MGRERRAGMENRGTMTQLLLGRWVLVVAGAAGWRLLLLPYWLAIAAAPLYPNVVTSMGWWSLNSWA